ncbi:MAG: hypothetical protein HY296_05400 [Thaumarchaeota archaeon]|nr:hypothetical protein [Nitrososphaerota archaeon]
MPKSKKPDQWVKDRIVPAEALSAERGAGPTRMEPDDGFKASVVMMILDSKPEEGLEMLCKQYRVSTPKLGIGVLEGRTKGVAAVYSVNRKEILAASREYLYDPFVLIHEFYHHLRSKGGRHRGTERQADLFAIGFLRAYRKAASVRPR